MAVPAISVLVPAYQSARYLEECLTSIVNQTFTDMEVVVVDDHSSDSTLDTAADFARRDARITVHRNESNIGSRANFRRCLEMASSPLVKFVCGDDMLSPHALERLIEAAGAHPDVNLVSSRRLLIDEQGAVLGEMPSLGSQEVTTVVDGYDAGDLLLTSGLNWIGEPSTVLFRAAALALDDDLYTLGSRHPARNVDVVWWLKVLAGRRMAFVNEPLSMFRTHAGQQSLDPSLKKDLVLSWFDIVEGATEIGYLGAPDDRAAAWSKVHEIICSHVNAIAPSDWPQVERILGEVSDRLQALKD